MRDAHMNAFCFDGRVRVSTLPLAPMVLARGIVRFALLFNHFDGKFYVNYAEIDAKFGLKLGIRL